MRPSTSRFVLTLGVLVFGGSLHAEIFNFDSVASGTVPSGWTSTMTHTGGAPKWQVVADGTAPSKPNVLAQLSNDPTDGRFPLAILEKANFKDGELSVKCKAIAG